MTTTLKRAAEVTNASDLFMAVLVDLAQVWFALPLGRRFEVSAVFLKRCLDETAFTAFCCIAVLNESKLLLS